MKEDALHAEERMLRLWMMLSIAGAAVFLYLRTFWVGGVPFVAGDDQMLFFVRAVRMVHGETPYRDFFELVTPGTDLLYWAGFRAFGVHAWVMQAWDIALGVTLAGVITGIAAKVLRGWLVLLPALLFLVFDFDTALDATHHWYSTLAALIAVRVLMGGASFVRIAAAGVLAGVATLFTQTSGVLVLLGLVVYLVWVGRSEECTHRFGVQVVTLVAAFAVVVGVVMGYYVGVTGWQTVWFDLVVFPLRYLSSGDVNSVRTYLQQLPTVHGVGDLFRLVPAVFIYVLVPYGYFVGLYRLWRERETMDAGMLRRMVLLHVVGLALFAAVASAPRLHRLCTVAPPAVLIFVWMVRGNDARVRILRRLMWGLAALFAVVLAGSRQVQRQQTLTLPIGRVAFVDAQAFREFEWLAQRTCPGEMFFNEGMLGLYLGLRSPGAMDFINTDDYSRPEWVAQTIEDLKARPPRYLVMIPDRAGVDEARNHAGPFVAFVQERYRLAERFPLQRSSRYEEVWELR